MSLWVLETGVASEALSSPKSALYHNAGKFKCDFFPYTTLFSPPSKMGITTLSNNLDFYVDFLTFETWVSPITNFHPPDED